MEVVGGGSVNLGSLNLVNGATVTVAGNQSYNLTGTSAGETLTTFGGNDTIAAGEGGDIISSGAGVDSVSAGGGDDVIIVSGKSTITDTLDGGSGTDTLRITGGDVDLSAATLGGIEKLEANSASLALTQQQYQQFQGNITGTAGLLSLIHI